MKSSYTPKQAQTILSAWPHRWWIAGGWALDLYIGKQTRDHEDLDIAILRNDTNNIREFLRSWDMRLGLGDGVLEEAALLPQVNIPEDRQAIWCRPAPNAPWAFELLLNKTEGDEWIFKRDDRIRKSIDDIRSVTKDGIPYLKPEIVLLFKAKSVKEKDQKDFDTVYKLLSFEARLWLREAITLVHPGHPWLKNLSD